MKSLEKLLAQGEVAGALILKGEFTDEEIELIRKVYETGFQHGKASVESPEQAA